METPECYYGGYGACTPEKQGKAGAGGGDHFIVEDLFDFSNEEDDDAGAAPDGGEFGAAAGNSAESSTVTAVDSGGNSANRELGFPGDLVCRGLVDSSLSGDLCEPYDELAELEWLSNFVEESFSSEDLEKLQLISGLKAGSGSGSGSGSASSSAGDRPPQGPVPGKARSKRSRAAPCSWSSRLLALSPPLMSTDSSSESEIFIPVANPVRKTPPLVAPRKKESAGPMMAPSDRRCLHCQTDKTPQWRTGPMGPKTLCNACGVRYKSGRLVPEYRPAASPTFVLSKHSNSHRKVLELRRQKEVIDHHHQYQHPLHPQYHHQQFLHGSVYDPPGQSAAGDDFLIHHHIGPDYRQLI